MLASGAGIAAVGGVSARVRTWWLAAGLVVASGCEREVDLEVQWLTWLSYREIEAVALMPDGGLAIAGRSISDEGRARIGFGQSTFRPLVARLDPDGAPMWTDLGFLGGAYAIAAGDDGSVYALTSAHEDLYGSACDLVARDPDGEVRWSRSMRTDEGCPTRLVGFGDRVVVQTALALDVLDRDGVPISRIEVDEGAQIDWLAASAGGLWALGTRGWGDDERFVAWRMPPDARTLELVVSEPSDGWSWGSAAVREDGIDAIQVHFDLDWPPSSGADGVRLAVFDLDGRMRRVVELEDLESAGTLLRPAAGDGWWLVGSTVVSTPALDSASRGMSSGRLWLRHLGPRGELGPRTTRWFAEPAGDAVERVECISSDAGPDGVHGTQARFAVVRPDGTVVIAGSQHCRDAWVAALEVR